MLSHAQAQSSEIDAFVQNHQQLVAKNPEGLTVTLKLKDSKPQFHVGEIIHLELSFASSLPETYVFDNASYDRSGRLDIDSFVLDHSEGVADPLYDYYHKSFWAFMGGGLRGIGALGTKPEVINYDLNEWLRFDKRGKYRLYVISHRLSKGKPYHQGNAPIEPVSNVIQFEIVPGDREWEQKTLSEAMKALDSAPKDQFMVGENPHRSACRVLRFIGTESAVKEIVKRFRGQDRDCDFEYFIGLQSAPDRAFTVAQMEVALDAPDQPVPGSFLSELAFLSYLVQNPQPLPEFPQGEVERKAWQLQWEARKAVYDKIAEQYAQRLAIAVKIKRGAAAAITTETLINLERNGKSKDSESRRKELAAALAKVFLHLPVETQRNLLEYRWTQTSDPAMLPVLRQLYDHPPDMHIIPQPFPGLALHRIYDLAPEEGRQLILDEIRRPELRIKISVLGLLPDKELPQLEDSIVERAINRTDETAMALVARYASPASLPRLRAGLENRVGELACAEQASLLSYFLRADQAFGLEMVKKAVLSRQHTHCYPEVLTAAAGETITPEFAALSREFLDDNDEEVVYRAVKVLCAQGSSQDKPKIKAAIKKILDQWRQEKKNPDAAVSGTNFVFAGYFAESMLRTYAYATAWLTEPDEFEELAALCLTEQCRQQLTPKDLTADTAINFFYFQGNDESRFQLGSYDALSWSGLKRKAIQFPKGTKFTWNNTGGAPDKDEQRFEELKTYLKEHGSELVRYERPKQ